MAYLDYNSTTPVDSRIVEIMVPIFNERFGNPSSVGHETGRAAGGLVEDARSLVGQTVGMRAPDVIFTSGATEANNLAFIGLRRGLGRPIRMLVGATEHKSVLQTCRALEEDGSTLNMIPVRNDGPIDLSALDNALTDDTDVVSVMAANSETGVVNPVREAARLAHGHGALLHCDATQAIGRIPFDAREMGIDMTTLSSHKIYGPKGAGALVATREARKRLAAVMHGGGQERDLRSGTPNVPAIVGFGMACGIAIREGLRDAARQRELRDGFEAELKSAVPGMTINGSGAERLPNTSSVRIAGALADAVIIRATGIEISTGSACSSSTMEPSHVLTAMGLDRDAADESIRVSIGRPTTKQDMDMAMSEIANAAQSVRKATSMQGVVT